MAHSKGHSSKIKQGNPRWQIELYIALPHASASQRSAHYFIFIFSWRHFSARLSFYILIDSATYEVPMKNIWKKLSVQFLRYIRHWIVRLDVYWLAYTLHFAIFQRFFWTILWEIVTSVKEFYMLNVKYWRIFCDVISLLAQFFIVSFDRAYKEVSTKKILKMLYGSVFIWLYLHKQYNVPVTLTVDLWRSNIFGELITTR